QLGSLVPMTSDVNEIATETTTTITTAPAANYAIETNLSEKSFRHHSHRKLRMAALNTPFSGDFHGIRGADYECYRQS
ncbi:unnamed protein product, partial [Oppiella nova]